jgi:hypothetical protein
LTLLFAILLTTVGRSSSQTISSISLALSNPSWCSVSRNHKPDCALLSEYDTPSQNAMSLEGDKSKNGLQEVYDKVYMSYKEF